MTTWWLDLIRVMLVGLEKDRIQNLLSNSVCLSFSFNAGRPTRIRLMLSFIDNEIFHSIHVHVPLTVLYMELLRQSSRRTSALYCVHVERRSHHYIRDNIQWLTIKICILCLLCYSFESISVGSVCKSWVNFFVLVWAYNVMWTFTHVF